MDEDTTRIQTLLKVVVHTVVRPSFQRCCEQGDEFFDAFYDRLSERAPEIGPMFAGVNMRRQNALLRSGIESLLGHAEGEPRASTELERLADLHDRRNVNVRPELYPIWVETLIECIREFDPKQDDLTEPAWREAISDGIELMISRY